MQANLNYADLTGANLDSANLDSAALTGAIWPGDDLPPGWKYGSGGRLIADGGAETAEAN